MNGFSVRVNGTSPDVHGDCGCQAGVIWRKHMKYTDQSQINTLRNAGRITHAEAATARSEMRGETVEVGKHERVKLPKKKGER